MSKCCCCCCCCCCRCRCCYDVDVIIDILQLIVGLSVLKAHKKKHKFKDTPSE